MGLGVWRRMGLEEVEAQGEIRDLLGRKYTWKEDEGPRGVVTVIGYAQLEMVSWCVLLR